MRAALNSPAPAGAHPSHFSGPKISEPTDPRRSTLDLGLWTLDAYSIVPRVIDSPSPARMCPGGTSATRAQGTFFHPPTSARIGLLHFRWGTPNQPQQRLTFTHLLDMLPLLQYPTAQPLGATQPSK